MYNKQNDHMFSMKFEKKTNVAYNIKQTHPFSDKEMKQYTELPVVHVTQLLQTLRQRTFCFTILAKNCL